MSFIITKFKVDSRQSRWQRPYHRKVPHPRNSCHPWVFPLIQPNPIKSRLFRFLVLITARKVQNEAVNKCTFKSRLMRLCIINLVISHSSGSDYYFRVLTLKSLRKLSIAVSLANELSHISAKLMALTVITKKAKICIVYFLFFLFSLTIKTNVFHIYFVFRDEIKIGMGKWCRDFWSICTITRTIDRIIPNDGTVVTIVWSITRIRVDYDIEARPGTVSRVIKGNIV